MSAWWKNAVFYQIYPRSFCDSSGDGVGDLRGIVERLDYLVWLGVDALWISPFYPSPMHDFGYDVRDYCDVDPLFGKLEDFDALLEAAHARGLRLIIDWVPAHTSSEHPWFMESRSARENPRRDWYVWRDAKAGGGVPNNWTSTFTKGAPAWTWDERTQQYYLHSFLPEQPDLNWANPEVVAAMHDTLRFWLARGVDGFRVDVAQNLAKDPAFRDVAPEVAPIPHSALNDEPGTHPLLRDIRRVLEEFPEKRVLLGEVFLLSTTRVASYYGRGDELQLAFNFPPLFAPWDAARWRECIETTIQALDPLDAWPTWVLSNHDVPRHRSRYGSLARAQAAAVLLLTLRGTPFLYMGEELGLENATVPPECVVDPGGRDGCRAPMPWEPAAPHGWRGSPWLPWPPEPSLRNVVTQRAEPDSMLQLYRRLLTARRASPALRAGSFELLDSQEGVLAFRRRTADDVRTIAINFHDEPARFEPGTRLEIEIASDGQGEGIAFENHLAPAQAVVLR